MNKLQGSIRSVKLLWICLVHRYRDVPCMKLGVRRNMHKYVYLGVLIQVTDPSSVEGGGAPDDAVHLIAFLQQQLGQV